MSIKNTSGLKRGNPEKGFQPGVSGNPGGRGVDEKMIRDYMLSVKEKDRTRLQAMIESFYQAAMGEECVEKTITESGKGKEKVKITKVMTHTVRYSDLGKFLMERGFGKLKETVEHTADGMTFADFIKGMGNEEE
jgi:hypothetical protein